MDPNFSWFKDEYLYHWLDKDFVLKYININLIMKRILRHKKKNVENKKIKLTLNNYYEGLQNEKYEDQQEYDYS